MPEDVVPITEKRYLSVIGNPPAGMVRAHDDKGLPYLISAPVIEPDLPAIEREWRDGALLALATLRDRHRDQLEIGAATVLTGEQFNELLVYLQALRDWPQSKDFPQSDKRPLASTWIGELVY
ncbi:phage tail assembly chaperone [uncultured Pseudomonas sp.]|uniref:phage tail assembly chaperone n=1 Tax=uncultured Pseudomonas sp. TaxID=114707 RepID=UPI0025F19CCC|nr:phage tail assembly chaperone [uncultured Pseudomonas sp.]